ncbi:hypothetical protein QQ045_008637 [Rhodiola kirilowii]
MGMGITHQLGRRRPSSSIWICKLQSRQHRINILFSLPSLLPSSSQSTHLDLQRICKFDSSVVQTQTSNADILTTNVELEANLNDEEVEIIETDIVADPGLRKPIESYERHNFPRKKYGKDNRAFRDAWFEEFEWLEYSVQNDAALLLVLSFQDEALQPGR